MLLPFAFLLLASAAPDGGVAAQAEDWKVVFSERYAAMKAAMASRNETAIAALLAPGFVSEDAQGKQSDAAEMIREVVALPKDPDRQSATRVVSVKVDGDTATVEQTYDASNPKKDFSLHAKSTDTWQRIRGQWLLKKSVTLELDITHGGHVEHRRHEDRP